MKRPLSTFQQSVRSSRSLKQTPILFATAGKAVRRVFPIHTRRRNGSHRRASWTGSKSPYTFLRNKGYGRNVTLFRGQRIRRRRNPICVPRIQLARPKNHSLQVPRAIASPCRVSRRQFTMVPHGFSACRRRHRTLLLVHEIRYACAESKGNHASSLFQEPNLEFK